jgi:hypothetical protein
MIRNISIAIRYVKAQAIESRRGVRFVRII